MKRILACLLALFLAWGTLAAAPALAEDIASGAKVFGSNCAACHIGGGNLVNPAKTLSKADLEANTMASLEAIKTQVTNGKGAMPSFAGRLSAADIENVASYVLDQAEKGW